VISQQGVASSWATANTTSYAGFWKRFAAVILDGIILGIVSALLVAILGRSVGTPLNTLIGWLYFAGMESSERQATLGKMALGIVVTDLDGNRISFARATLRYFAKIISALILMIGFLMAAFTQRKQALHDMIAGTLVLNRG
jgi:uncharacterized RDD family membrane protein YckC